MSSGTYSLTVLLLRCLAHSIQREKHHNVSVCVNLGMAGLRACYMALSDIGAASKLRSVRNGKYGTSRWFILDPAGGGRFKQAVADLEKLEGGF